MIAVNETLDDITSRQIVSARVFHAPQALVFEAWENPLHLAEWWGPKGFTNNFEEFDFSPNGTWKFVMHGPDGGNYKNLSVFKEIIKPALIVFDHVSPPKFQVTATFEDLGNKTRLVFQMLFPTAEDCEKVKPIVVGANEENFDRLEARLAKMQS